MTRNREEHEACGRCAMSSVAGFTLADRDDEERAERDPLGGSRIEVDDADLRRVSPGAWFAGLVGRIDDAATRLTYGKR